MSGKSGPWVDFNEAAKALLPDDTIKLALFTRRPRRPLEPRLFTASGEEVFVSLTCTKCHRTAPLRAFGLRRMEGKIRSIPQCKRCRGSNPKRRRT